MPDYITQKAESCTLIGIDVTVLILAGAVRYPAHGAPHATILNMSHFYGAAIWSPFCSLSSGQGLTSEITLQKCLMTQLQHLVLRIWCHLPTLNRREHTTFLVPDYITHKTERGILAFDRDGCGFGFDQSSEAFCPYLFHSTTSSFSANMRGPI